ncbi:hypothetical protein TeGR_g3918, partial [Tetraparma gracilis]
MSFNAQKAANPKGPPPSASASSSQSAASSELSASFAASRPKGLLHGLSNAGASLASGAAMGGAALVGMPVVMGRAGAQSGAVGAVFGGLMGTVLGAVVAPIALVGGVAGAGLQVGLGVAAVPGSVVQPRRGKRWCQREGRWVLENLGEEVLPGGDDDILNGAQGEEAPVERHKGGVKDTKYYDALNASPSSDEKTLRKKYYVAARDCHPDRNQSPEAKARFQEVSEAFQVLSDPKLRKKYDEHGLDALSGDRTEAVDTDKIDPTLLYSFMFGSDKLYHLVGRLALATSAMVDDSKISKAQAAELQRRRVGRIAVALAAKLDRHLDAPEAATGWEAEAAALADTSFGAFMLEVIGNAYQLTAVEFLGAFDSGIGMPSIAKWAKSKGAGQKLNSTARKAEFEKMKTTLGAVNISMKVAKNLEEAKDDEQKKKQVEIDAQKELLPSLINIFWMTTVVDVTSTLHEACEKVPP